MSEQVQVFSQALAEKWYMVGACIATSLLFLGATSLHAKLHAPVFFMTPGPSTCSPCQQ